MENNEIYSENELMSALPKQTAYFVNLWESMPDDVVLQRYASDGVSYNALSADFRAITHIVGMTADPVLAEQVKIRILNPAYLQKLTLLNSYES